MMNQTWKPICIVLVCSKLISQSSENSWLNFASGRTGRFGRRGISINFVHNQKTWQQMDQIEKALGRQIIRIETTDLDLMEEVSDLFHIVMRILLKNDGGCRK